MLPPITTVVTSAAPLSVLNPPELSVIDAVAVGEAHRYCVGAGPVDGVRGVRRVVRRLPVVALVAAI